MTYHIYGIGNALVDQEYEVADSFFREAGIQKGVMTLIDEAQMHALRAHLQSQSTPKKQACGGSAANTILAATYFGAKTFYSCNVAADADGDFYAQDLTAAGVDSNINGHRDQGHTGKCTVMISPDAERTMNTFLGITADLDEKHIREEVLAQAQYVYIEGYLVTSPTSRAAAIKVRELARKHGVKVALTCSDPAMTQYFRDGLLEMIGDGVDMLFCNEEEAQLLAGVYSLDEAIAFLKSKAKTFAITQGAKGAMAFDGQQLHQIAPHVVTPVDTNGAGDAFAGAFLYALTHGYDYPAAGRLASMTSAKLITQFGPRLAPKQYVELLPALNPA